MLLFDLDKRFNKPLDNFVYTSGVYGLLDPITSDVRYVGSSVQIERRLYAHHHHSTKHRPIHIWMQQMVNGGKNVQACLLELVSADVLNDRRARHDRERYWIEHFHLLGQADLNTQLTPPGHQNCNEGPLQMMRIHMNYLQNLLRENGIAFVPHQEKKGLYGTAKHHPR